MEDFEKKVKPATTMATKKYRLTQWARNNYETLVTLVNGAPVSLTGVEVVNERPGKKDKPPVKVTARPATQADLKYLFDVEKHPFIEEYED